MDPGAWPSYPAAPGYSFSKGVRKNFSSYTANPSYGFKLVGRKLITPGDNYVDKAMNNSNFGLSNDLIISDVSDIETKWTDMLFPWGGDPFSAATLYLYSRESRGGYEMYIDYLNNTFVETTETWNNKPASTQVLTVNLPSSPGWVSYNVLTLIQLAQGNAWNYGIRLRGKRPSFEPFVMNPWYFYSRHYSSGSYAPYLILVWG